MRLSRLPRLHLLPVILLLLLLLGAPALNGRPGAAAQVPAPPPPADRGGADPTSCATLNPTWVALGIGIERGGEALAAGRTFSVSDGTLAVLIIVTAADAAGAAVSFDFLASHNVEAVIVATAAAAEIHRFRPAVLTGGGLTAPDEAGIAQISFCYRPVTTPPLPAGEAPAATVAAWATATAAAEATATVLAGLMATATAEVRAARATADARATEIAQTEATAAVAAATARATEAARATLDARATADTAAAEATIGAQATTAAETAARATSAAAGLAAALATATAETAAHTAALATAETAATDQAATAEAAATDQAAALATSTARAAEARATADTLATTQVAQEETLATTQADLAAAQAAAATAQADVSAAQAEVTAAQAAAAEAQATAAALATSRAAEALTATAFAAPTATPTPAPPPPSETPPLYHADTSGGFETWALPAGWSIVGGMLVAEGATGAWATPAFRVEGTNDYTVEIEVRIVGSPECQSNFGIGARGSDLGYYAAGIEWRCDPAAMLWAGQEAIASVPFVAGDQWHHLRLEVRGETVRLLVDGTLVLQTTDSRFPEGGEVGLWSGGVSLEIRRFTVTAATQG